MKYTELDIEFARPARTVYLLAVIVAATFWLGWPGLVMTVLMTLDYTTYDNK